MGLLDMGRNSIRGGSGKWDVDAFPIESSCRWSDKGISEFVSSWDGDGIGWTTLVGCLAAGCDGIEVLVGSNKTFKTQFRFRFRFSLPLE